MSGCQSSHFHGTVEAPAVVIHRKYVISKYKHLTFDDRLTIEKLIKNGMSFKVIGRTIGKDCTTVSKEVRGRIRFRRTSGRTF